MKKVFLTLMIVSAASLGGCNKITGGGWFIDSADGDRVSFGFVAQEAEEPTGECEFNPFGPSEPCVEAKGRLNLIDHGDQSGERIHVRGRFIGTYTGQAPFECEAQTPCTSRFEGTAFVNGAEHLLTMRVTDYGEGVGTIDGDYFEIFLSPVGGGDLLFYQGNIEGGNIQVHL